MLYSILVNLVVNKKSPYYISVMLDTENYRQRRKETLKPCLQSGEKGKAYKEKCSAGAYEPL